MVILKHLGSVGQRQGGNSNGVMIFCRMNFWSECMENERGKSCCFADGACPQLLLRVWPFRRLDAVYTYEI